jgi:pimeloyl-ACP methyl ester carboxylesterase
MDIDLEREAGRTIRVHSAGATDGPLIVYLHGAPSSRLDVDDIDDRSRVRGVRLAAIDRPGYGGSTYAPYGFATVAADVCAVADLLEVDTFAVIGQSAGAPYALAAAALYPDRVTAVATGGGPAPFHPESPWWANLSVGEQEGVRLLGIDDDRANDLLAHADLPAMDALALNDDGLLSFWFDLLGPADRRYLDARLGPRFVATVRESLRQGQTGWARDNVVWMGAWAFELADIRCQTTLWYGDEDHWQPGEWVAARVPKAALRVLPDRGHLVMFEEWDQVLDDLGFARKG